MIVLTHIYLTKKQFIVSSAYILFTLYVHFFIDGIWVTFSDDGLKVNSKTFEIS